MKRWEGYRMSKGQGNNVVKIYCVKKFYRKIRCYSDSTAFRDDLFVLHFFQHSFFSLCMSSLYIFLFVFFFQVFKTGSHCASLFGLVLTMQIRLPFKLQRSVFTSNSQRSTCLYFQSTGIQCICHYAQCFIYTIRWIVYFQFCLILCKSLLPRQTSFNFEKFSFIVLLRIFCPPLLWYSSPCYRSRFFHGIPQLSYVLFTHTCKPTHTYTLHLLSGLIPLPHVLAKKFLFLI